MEPMLDVATQIEPVEEAAIGTEARQQIKVHAAKVKNTAPWSSAGRHPIVFIYTASR